jgi:hypothetical protein
MSIYDCGVNIAGYVLLLNLMSKELYHRNKVMTKAEFDKLKLPAKPWDDEQIPPLVTMTNPKDKKEKHDKI